MVENVLKRIFIISLVAFSFFFFKVSFASATLLMDSPTYTAGSSISYSGMGAGGCAVYDAGATSTPSHETHSVLCGYPTGSVELNSYPDVGGAFDNTIPGIYYLVSLNAMSCIGVDLETCIAGNNANSGTLSDNTFEIIASTSTPTSTDALPFDFFGFASSSIAYATALRDAGFLFLGFFVAFLAFVILTGAGGKAFASLLRRR